MIDQIAKTFTPQEIEKKWYATWDKGNYFVPQKRHQSTKNYSIIVPPPNVTGRLHMGHALDATTQDILIRYHRMLGDETLFLPGKDHAGIATQSVVEKMIFEKEKKTRQEIGREDFLKRIWEWKEEYGDIITEQQKAIGVSVDWNYSLFTMDPAANEAVNKFFVQMFNKGLIYQSDYIVNWDPGIQSAISDAEVEHKEVKGAFYHLKYQLEGTSSDEYLEVATTRPETMFADTAVAVHPEDERFKHLIGKNVIIPLCKRIVPIIGDEYVDREMGTGCLKVTPGHDFNDFEIGKRHQLPIIKMLNLDGTLNLSFLDQSLPHNQQLHKELSHLSCAKARKILCEQLLEQGYLLSTKEHVHNVGHAERSGAIVEPMVSRQWFLNVQEMANIAVKAVENDQTTFYPKSWENTYFSWLREPKDWCISRQLWWGHRIPVYTCQKCQHVFAAETTPSECSKCKHSQLTQDPDVLDTWFSSGLWPLTTLGWPNTERMKEKGFDKFYPNSVLVTGFDIIFFWVARMMMMCMETVEQIPFHHVYIHAIVRDKLGRKMSKSLGNGIDPLKVIDELGADALRFTLAFGSGHNRTLNLDPERIEGQRNFMNKIWNAFRFICQFVDSPYKIQQFHLEQKISHLDISEKWIIHELNSLIGTVHEAFAHYRFDDACQAIYSFVYDKYCSWFLELSKPLLQSDDLSNREKSQQRFDLLIYILREIVKLIHPISPFISEEIWQYLKNDQEDLLIVTRYPEKNPLYHFAFEGQAMNKLIEAVSSIRMMKQGLGLSPKEVVEVHISLSTSLEASDQAQLAKFFLAQTDQFHFLAKANLTLKESNQSSTNNQERKKIIQAVTFGTVNLYIDDVSKIDQQLSKLKKDLIKQEQELEKINKKIHNENFMKNAPEEVVQEVYEKQRVSMNLIQGIKEGIQLLS